MTLNGGVRYDHFAGHTLAQDIPAGRFRPAFSVARGEGSAELPRLAGPGWRRVRSVRQRQDGDQGLVWVSTSQGRAACSASRASRRRWRSSTTRPDDTFVAGMRTTALHPRLQPERPDRQRRVRRRLATRCSGSRSRSRRSPTTRGKGGATASTTTSGTSQLQQELRPGLGLAVGFFHTEWKNMLVSATRG